MLNFNAELQAIYEKVKADYSMQPFTPVDYPAMITESNWDEYSESIVIPPVQGCLYFIFDENKNLLYIGKTIEIEFALKCHLICRTSKSMASILDTIKELITYSKRRKRVYVKTVDFEPTELSAAIKIFLIRDLKPLLVKRVS